MACDNCPHGYKGLDGREQPECHTCEKRKTHRWFYLGLLLAIPLCDPSKVDADPRKAAKKAIKCVKYIDELPNESPPWEGGKTLIEAIREIKESRDETAGEA